MKKVKVGKMNIQRRQLGEYTYRDDNGDTVGRVVLYDTTGWRAENALNMPIGFPTFEDAEAALKVYLEKDGSKEVTIDA